MEGTQVASKWLKTEALLSDARVASHIPLTRIYSPDQLQRMLNEFGFVVIKPVVGGGGYGVIKVTKTHSSYSFTSLSSTRTFSSFQALIRALATAKKKRKYLIQQGIHLATISGRPIDYRVKVVKKDATWVFRAIVGRLAKNGLFVTNLSKGGTQLTSSEALRLSLSEDVVDTKREEMKQLTRICTEIMDERFPGLGRLGFDYGIDQDGVIWILEVNTRPR
ncbi:YheC/YheD family protein [Paenibacillus sp. SC116]|uniref:YheC/YheD family protein n=1 Tax=Paenibacillus sp. SC116 TaxID=2968986 RepID=UPI00215B6530|nr:YheC/YheD family protein [Paenibacillus sp. SC116]MCR8846102.1 YheC/YheD family protein [Paenibacillus sp. SC116]